MSIWTCAGQAGKHLPAALVDVEEMGLLAAKLNFRSQNEDSFDFFMESPSPTADPDYLPDHEQIISVYRNNIRQFTGKIQDIQFTWDGGRVGWSGRAIGGWSELERIPLTASNSSYERAQGDLRLTIIDIINTAIAGGAQIALGTIATCFDVIPLTFRGLSCSAALIEALRFIPDAVTYFDYTGSGFPVLNIARRPSMATRTYTFGTDEIARCNISPMAGQTPDRVAVTYATHDINGIVTQTTQTAGTGTAANQVVILAESGFAEFTTRATAAQIALQTSTVAGWAYAQATDPKLKDIPGIPTPTTGNVTYIGGPTSGSKTNVTLAGRSPAFTGVTAPNLYPLILGEVKDYMREKLGITTGTATFTADFWWIWRKTINGASQNKPDWLVAVLAAGGYVEENGWFNSTQTVGAYYGPHPDYDTTLVIRYPAQFTAVTINRAIPTQTNFRDPGDYLSTPPPATLAASLLSVQSFTPYRGRVTFTAWQAYARDLGGKCNFPGANPRIAAVGALAQEEEVNLQTGVRELIIGQPSRTGLATLMSRFRRVSS